MGDKEKSSEKSYSKPKRYALAKAGARHIILAGFPYPIDNEILQGPSADKHIYAIQAWEKETGHKVIGDLIVLK